ncbi:Hypothetical predicted protein [Cloeon dipterum]|uniref:BolA-like protein 3 n=2 Tax=Cloeon dipterum TaxID=197152 RepID=A0A8S1CUA8_9INSE|nr:Hypothetical predicted protein [Cloeon dipterum]
MALSSLHLPSTASTLHRKNQSNSTKAKIYKMIRRLIQKSWQSRSISILSQLWNGPQVTAGGVEAERRLQNLLQRAFPAAKDIQVADISGGCGAMYEIFVEAPEFKGLSVVKQHRLVNEALREEIKEMHGLRISTTVAK